MRVLQLAHESVSLAGKRSKMPTRKILQSKAKWQPNSILGVPRHCRQAKTMSEEGTHHRSSLLCAQYSNGAIFIPGAPLDHLKFLKVQQISCALIASAERLLDSIFCRDELEYSIAKRPRRSSYS